MKKSRLLVLFGSVFLVLALLVTLTGGLLPAMAKKSKDGPPPGIEKQIEEAVEPEISFAGEVPLVPDVAPVIVVQGSDYDMGYQYAQQLNQIFGPWHLEDYQCDFTEEDIVALKAYQWYVKEYAPEFIEHLKGFADGATDAGVELSYEEALASYCMRRGGVTAYPGTEPAGSEDDNLPPNDCSSFVAWGSATTDGSLICAGNGDDTKPRWVWRVIFIPETGNNYLYAPCAGGSGHPSMNNKGLAYAHHGNTISGNEAPGYGVPGKLMTQHTLRFADNCEEALEILLAYPTNPGGLWADVGGDAFNLDCRDPEVVRRAGDHGEEDFLYTTNTVMCEELKPFLEAGQSAGHSFGWPINYFEHGGWNMDDMNSVRRALHIWNAFHNYHGEIDLEFAKMLYRMPGPAPDYPTLEEAEIELYETYGEGWDTYVGSLSNAALGIMLPDDGDNGLYYAACSGAVGRQAEPFTAGYYKFEIANTYTFYELQLAADPAAIVNAAKQRSQYDLYDANKELRKLTYADVAYAPLNEIFDKAATESQVGGYYLDLARSTQGNESVYNYGKALRAYTKCQAYAKQVYESLVPPAYDPEDLGLDEWFGGWGEWEVALSGLDGDPDP